MTTIFNPCWYFTHKLQIRQFVFLSFNQCTSVVNAKETIDVFALHYWNFTREEYILYGLRRYIWEVVEQLFVFLLSFYEDLVNLAPLVDRVISLHVVLGRKQGTVQLRGALTCIGQENIYYYNIIIAFLDTLCTVEYYPTTDRVVHKYRGRSIFD